MYLVGGGIQVPNLSDFFSELKVINSVAKNGGVSSHANVFQDLESEIAKYRCSLTFFIPIFFCVST